ncbi:YceI family protein [Aquimarina agarivorans]|uniref:YceI family protein n=1 Tax=Aquimarina agarivorans TaxID=980584 RepID=UPI001EE6665F|nr:YceI family protein [Aquimarina agarivorans]
MDSVFGQQTYKTATGIISFNAAKTAIEPIQAKNSQVKVAFRPSDGALVGLLKVSDFVFPNALMQEHFNENYMESEQYPTASFEAKIDDLDNLLANETKVKGVFNIHGIKKELFIPITLIKKGEGFELKSNFKLLLKDFKIKVPSLMFYKIAEVVDVVLNARLTKVEQ